MARLHTRGRRRALRVHSGRWLVAVLSGLTLTSAAAAEAPADRYDVSTSGTVRDSRTELIWQREVDEHTFVHADALAYCSALTLAGGGWRLPTRAELLTIVDPTESTPAIDSRAFPSTPASWFWTVTSYMDSSQGFWTVSFEDGSSDYFGYKRDFRVRCVR